VPDRWNRGVLTTGVVVLDSPHEFVLDFMQGLTRPYQVVARVVIAPTMMDKLIATAQDNLAKYTQQFGPPAPLPKPPQQRPTIQEIYENFKLPDEQLSGAYCNSILIGHSPAEFYIDFVTAFYPTAAVSARVLMAAQQFPRLVDTLNVALTQWRKKQRGGEQQG
jgi:hypothetical protein